MRYLLFLLLFVCIPLFSTRGYSRSPRRIKVLPILFIPADANLGPREIRSANRLIESHLLLAQGLYKKLLRTDTFALAQSTFKVYRSSRRHSFYVRRPQEWKNLQTDSAHTITREIFDLLEENRYNSYHIFLIVYVRPSGSRCHDGTGRECFIGGRPFNGGPGSGGAFVQLEYDGMIGKPGLVYRFQSTLVHELGHAFGLPHVSAYGRSMKNDNSIMSYNGRLASRGLKPSNTPGILHTEELYALSMNKKVFPNFRFHASSGLDKIRQVYLGPMSDKIGKIQSRKNEGYELFYNGRRVNGASASFYTFHQAWQNCKWNVGARKNILIACKYNGIRFFPRLNRDHSNGKYSVPPKNTDSPDINEARKAFLRTYLQ